MANWIRAATLQVGSSSFTLDGIDFSFTVSFQDSEELGSAKIEVKNLSDGTRRGMQRKDPVILNAGYEGDIGAIFVGEIETVRHRHEGTEWITSIQAIEAMDIWINGQINKTYNRDTTLEDIIRDEANLSGIELAYCDVVDNVTYPTGLVSSGGLMELLQGHASQDGKSRMLIHNDQLYINNPADPIMEGPLLSPATGLLQCDEDKEMTLIETDLTEADTREEKDEAAATKKRTCLLNYNIGPAYGVMFQSKSLNGRYMVVRGQHRGSQSGDWVTEIEVKPL